MAAPVPATSVLKSPKNTFFKKISTALSFQQKKPQHPPSQNKSPKPPQSKPQLPKKILLLAFAIPLLLVVITLASKNLFHFQSPPPSTTPTPQPNNSPTNPAPTSTIPLLSIDQISTDSDSDVIPDQLEIAIGTDPQKIDCLRETGCGQLPPIPKVLRPTQKRQLNLVYLLDASGSMNDRLPDNRTKIDLAKQALIQEITQELPDKTRVGIIVYGHQGSTSTADKETSCTSVETVKPLDSSYTHSDLNNRLDQIQATGWTPLDLALQKAEQLLKPYQDAINYLVVLSDGMETCNGNPASTAQRLKESGTQVTTSVVGLAVTPEEQTQLESIASAGGGEYYSAKTALELTQALRRWSEIANQWEQIRACIFQNFTRYSGCINLQYLKSIEYLTQSRTAYESQQEVLLPPSYYHLESRLWQKLKALRNENRRWYTQESLTTNLNF